MNTYEEVPVTVRAIVPKWVPKKWEVETVYETLDVYSPTLHATHTAIVSHTVTVAVIPSNDQSVVNTAAPNAVLLSSINDHPVVTANADDVFLA